MRLTIYATRHEPKFDGTKPIGGRTKWTASCPKLREMLGLEDRKLMPFETRREALLNAKAGALMLAGSALLEGKIRCRTVTLRVARRVKRVEVG